MTSDFHLLDFLSLTSPPSATRRGFRVRVRVLAGLNNNHMTLDVSPISPALYADTTLKTASAGSDRSIGRCTNKSIEQTKKQRLGEVATET